MSSPKYKVLIYPIAENDLLDIKSYFINELSISPNILFQKLYDTIDLLENNPMLFPLSKDPYLEQLGYRMVPIDNYLLFYVIVEKTVQIHRFLYGKRNYRELF